jgi:hypothetical protein
LLIGSKTRHDDGQLVEKLIAENEIEHDYLEEEASRPKTATTEAIKARGRRR